MSAESTLKALEAEISHLKTLLAASRFDAAAVTPTSNSSRVLTPTPTPSLLLPASHALLLLSDSALPLGSFAFSSGLESYLAHNNRSQNLGSFLTLSLLSLASTSLPYLLAAHRTPHLLPAFDSTLDACILCPVARRASVSQGCALLTVWERAFRAAAVGASPLPTAAAGAEDKGGDGGLNTAAAAAEALAGFGAGLKRGRGPLTADWKTDIDGEAIEVLSGHFAPLWAVVALAMGVAEREAAYVFFLNHAKAVVSAAVRASVVGPYQAQGVLASGWLRGEIERVMNQYWNVTVADAGQAVPAMDLWVGRHEMLYSRIFNS